MGDLTSDEWLDVVFYNSRGHLAVYHGGPRGFQSQGTAYRAPLTAPVPVLERVPRVRGTDSLAGA